MYKYILIWFCWLSFDAYAIVPTIDQHQLSEDVSTVTSYASTLGVYLNQLSQVMTAAEQVKQLHSLEQVSALGTAVCQLCNLSDTKKLATYVQQVNDDLCSQFSFAMQNITGLAQSAKDIEGIIQLLQTNPKAAGLALQRAAIRTQTASQNTLSQIQLLLVQQNQKILAEQKLEQQNTDAVYAGFKQSGL